MNSSPLNLPATPLNHSPLPLQPSRMRQFLKRKLVLFNEQGLRSLRAVDIFDELMRFLHHFIAFVGADIFVEHFRWTFQTYVSFFSLVLFAVNLIYTVTVHWGEWYAVMDTLSISGIGFQGMIKMWSGLSNVEFFRKKRADLRSMHARNGRHPENNYVLLKNVLVILYIFRFFSVSYSVAGLFLFVIPGYMLMVRNEEVLLFALEIPTVDPLTHTGYVVTMGYQVFMVFLAIAGILAADMGIMIIVLHIVGIVDVFRNTMNELDQLLEDPDCEDDEIHEKVTEICMMHKEIIGYEEELNEHYFFTVFVQVITSVTCLSMTLFVIFMKGDWTRVMFLFATFFQLLEFCALGTSLTLKVCWSLVVQVIILQFSNLLLERSHR